MEQGGGHDISKTEGNEAGQTAEDEELPRVFLDTLHVHFQSCEEHDVVESDSPEELEGVVTLQDIQPVLANEHTRQHHTDDMGNPQLTHNDRCREDNQQHHEEDERGVGDGEILCQ